MKQISIHKFKRILNDPRVEVLSYDHFYEFPDDDNYSKYLYYEYSASSRLRRLKDCKCFRDYRSCAVKLGNFIYRQEKKNLIMRYEIKESVRKYNVY